MCKSNKVKSSNKQLETIFKDLKTMPFEEINKILGVSYHLKKYNNSTSFY